MPGPRSVTVKTIWPGSALTASLTSLPSGVRVSHRSLNDGAVEGLVAEKLALVSVQYHPEASPGPHDSVHLFDRFADLTETKRARVPAAVAG